MRLTEYITGLKKEVMDALRGIFDESYPDPQLRNRVKVTLDYPDEEIRFPAIYITYNEGPIQNSGIGHYELDDQTQSPYYHWWFSGTLTFHILALSTIDRDMLASGVVNMLAFKGADEYKNFHDDLQDADWIVLHPTTDYISPGGMAESPVPWDVPDQLVYASSYSIELTGEFYSDITTSDLIQISRIDAYPYLPNDQVPTGAGDSAEWS